MFRKWYKKRKRRKLIKRSVDGLLNRNKGYLKGITKAQLDEETQKEINEILKDYNGKFK